MGIKNYFSSPRYPQANGQTKVTNQTLLKIIKVWLEGEKGAWLEELPYVLWAYRMIARTLTRETPFKLAFGIEAVIPMEVSLSSLERKPFDEKTNNESHWLDLDCLDEVRKDALRRMMKYKRKMMKYHD